jgi:hypothetical protein
MIGMDFMHYATRVGKQEQVEFWATYELKVIIHHL